MLSSYANQKMAKKEGYMHRAGSFRRPASIIKLVWLCLLAADSSVRIGFLGGYLRHQRVDEQER